MTSSLSGLLWLESANRAGLGVHWRDNLRVGLIAGLPALLVAVAVLGLV